MERSKLVTDIRLLSGLSPEQVRKALKNLVDHLVYVNEADTADFETVPFKTDIGYELVRKYLEMCSGDDVPDEEVDRHILLTADDEDNKG